MTQRPVFISHSSDTSGVAERIATALRDRFGADLVHVASGRDEDAREHDIAACGVTLAIVGPTWAPSDRDIAEDVAAAARHGVAVVPVLVEGGELPPAQLLPPQLAPLRRRAAVIIDDAAWDEGVADLAFAIEHFVGVTSDEARPSSRGVRPATIAAVVAALVLAGFGSYMIARSRTPRVVRVTQPTPSVTATEAASASPTPLNDPAATASLIALVPGSYRDTCIPILTHEFTPIAAASIGCTPEDAPVAVFYFAFDTQDDMNRLYDERLAEEQVDASDSCGRDATGHLIAGLGSGTWNRDGDPVGRVMTYVGANGVDVMWTHDTLRVLGQATHFDNDPLRLCRWWDASAGPIN